MANDYLREALQERTKAWLEGEHDYQFAKNQNANSAHARNSLKYTLDIEIPGKWTKFQRLRELKAAEVGKDNKLKLPLQVGQSVLKVCAAARAAYVWDGVARGASFDESNAKTWESLDEYYDLLNEHEMELPSAYSLKLPIKKAVNKYFGPSEGDVYGKVMPTFISTVGLAITALIEQPVTKNNEVIFPAPGVASGAVFEWLAHPRS